MKKRTTSLFLSFLAMIMLSLTSFAQLSGSYTIDPNGTGTNNYTSFSAATSALSTSGVNGAVTFYVKQGTYTEQVSLGAYTGASATNTISFESDPTNTTNPIITFAPTSSAATANFTLAFNNANYVKIDGLTIETSGTTYGRLVTMIGTSNNAITVNNCVFNGDAGTSNSTFWAHWYATGVKYDSLFIENSTFNDGSYGVYLNSSSSNLSTNFVFRNNDINGFRYGYGVAPNYCISVDISNNKIHQSASATSFGYGARVYGWSGNTTPGKITIHDNDIYLNYGYGIYAYYAYGVATDPTSIYNNAIVFKNSGTSYNYGMYIYHPSHMLVAHNTVRTGSNYATNRGIYTSASTNSSYPTPGILIKNNIFHNEVQGYPAYFYVSSIFASSYVTSQDNLFYSPASGLSGYYNGTTNHSSFSAYQTASGDTTSSEGDAQFTNAEDWHIEGLAASNNAQPMSSITVDLDGDTRSSTAPDRGADEFVPPACATPSGVAVGALSSSSASISWVGTAASYDLEWGPTGFTQGTGTTGTSSTTTTSIAVGPSTTYDLYIRANCVASGNGYSGWNGPLTFTTPCLPAAMPIIETFATWTPQCWNLDNGQSSWLNYTSGGVSMAEANYWSVNNSSYIMESQPVILSSSAQVKYDWSHWGQYSSSYPYDSLSVRVRGANSSTWTTLVTHSAANNNFASSGSGVSTGAPGSPMDQEIVFIPSTFTGDTVVVQFYAWSDYGPDLFLDNITIEAQPACPPPMGLSVIGTGSSSATVTFTPAAANTDFTVNWGPVGFTPGTGGSSFTSSNDTITFTGLTASTTYEVYVYGNCGTTAGTSATGPVTFTTTCLPVVIPASGYSENFDGSNWTANVSYQNDVFDPCWSRDPVNYSNFAFIVNSGGTPSSSTGPSAANSGSNYLYTEASIGGSGQTARVYTPAFDLSGMTNPEVSFYYHMYGASILSLDVQVSADNGATWSTLSSIIGQQQTSHSAAWAQHSVNVSSYVGDTIIIQISTGKGASFTNDVGIDDFAINDVLCSDPVITLDSTSSTSVTLSWSAGAIAPAGSKIIWGPQGFYQGTGISGTTINGVTSPYTVGSLTPNSYYDFYVQDSCGPGASSLLVGPLTAKTNCVSQLSGTYTIDPAGTGATNFTSMDSAMQFLGACGINGPVIFNVAAGSYSATIDLGDIVGGDSINTVTINGPSTGVAEVTAVTGSSGVAIFDGTEYVTITGLTLVNPVGQGVILTGGANHITLHDNVIVGDTTGTGSSAAITATASITSPTSYGNNAHHITITDNHVKGGYYGIVINGQSTTNKISDFVINGNTLTKHYFYGIRTYYVENISIVNNSVTDNRASGGYGVMCYYTNDFVIEGNYLPAKTYGLYLYYANVYGSSGTGYTPTSQSKVVNNMVTGGTYGAYNYSPRFVDYYHNTFRGNTYGAYFGQTTLTGASQTNLDIRNNIFVGGSNYAFYALGTAPPSLTMDYNVYNSGGSNIANFYGTVHATLAAWKTASSSYNANSDDGPVNFMSNDDLHLITGANNIGTPIAGVTTDIDGDTRSTTNPDIGADEYSPIQTDALNDKIVGANGGCGDSTTMLYTVFQNFGLDTITSLPVELLITDASGAVTTLNATYTGSVLPMAYDTLLMGTLNTYAGGTYDFKSYTQLTNDGRANNDTIMIMGSEYLPYEPVVHGMVDTVCPSQDSVILTAVNVPGTTYGWYGSDTSSTILATGDSLTVSTAGQTSYFVGYLNTADSLAGPIPGGNGSAGNMFNVINTSGAPLSITGFAQGPGSGNSSQSNVTVQVYYSPGDYTTQPTSSWVAAGSAVTNLTSSASTGYVPVAVTIPAGATYGFYVGLTSGSVQYTNGTGTPGVSTWFSNNDMTVTEGLGGSYPNPTFSPRCWNGTIYYGAAGCSNLRAEVEFAVNTDSALAVGTGVETDPLTGTFDFDATGSVGNSYTWYFGDSLGTVGSGMMTQHVYGAAGVYTVSLVVMDTVCGSMDSISFQVTSTVSIDENGLDQAVRVFPNPSNGQLAVQIHGVTSFEGSLEIINGVGKVLVKEVVSKQEGRFELPLDLRQLPKGVYTLRLSGEEGMKNIRVVLQ